MTSTNGDAVRDINAEREARAIRRRRAQQQAQARREQVMDTGMTSAELAEFHRRMRTDFYARENARRAA